MKSGAQLDREIREASRNRPSLYGEGCSCGEQRDHEIAKRQTADERTFYVWSDGTLTWGDVGRTQIKGIGRSGAAWSRKRDRRIAKIISDNDGLINAADLAKAFKAGRAFAAQQGAWGADDSAWRYAILKVCK